MKGTPYIPIAGRFLAAFGMAVFLCPSVVRAQTLPRSVEPGRIEKQFSRPPQTVPQKEVVIPVFSDGAVVPERAAEIRFRLENIRIEGATAFSGEELTATYRGDIGTEITLARLYEIAAAITQLYRDEGYFLSIAVVPPQRIKSGTATIRVVEGFFADVVIEGDPQAADALRPYRSELMAARPIRRNDLEQVLLLAQDRPGMNVSAAIEKAEGGKLGASRLHLTATHTPFRAFARLDNRGTRYVGPLQQLVQAELNNSLGLSERIQFQEVTTVPFDDLQYLQSSITLPLNEAGTTLSLTVSGSHSEPGYRLEALDVKSYGTYGEMAVRHPLVRSVEQSWFVGGTFSLANTRTDIQGLRNFEDRLRAVRVNTQYLRADSFAGSNMIELEASKGLDILDARETGDANLSRAGGHSDFTKLTLDASRRQGLGQQLSLMLAVSGQYAGDPLLSSEEFGYGGSGFGRGYDSSEITGDHGVSASAELNYAFSESQTLPAWDLYGFYDIGAVWNIEESTGDKRQTGASTGIGVRTSIERRVNLGLELAKPLTRKTESTTNDNDPRLFFYLSSGF